MRKRLTLSFVLSALVIIAALVVGAGCAATPEERAAQLKPLKDARDATRSQLVATTRQVAQLKADLEALPPGEERDAVLGAVEKVEDSIPTLNAKLDKLDQVIAAVERGDPGAVGAGLGGLLEGVPGVGKYAGLAGAVLGFGFGVYQQLRRKREVAEAVAEANAASIEAELNGEAADGLRDHLKSVVHSIEEAGPEWSEEHKAAVGRLQGPETSRLVADLKDEMGLPDGPAIAGVGAR